MKLYAGQKLFLAGVSAIAVISTGLFALTWIQLREARRSALPSPLPVLREEEAVVIEPDAKGEESEVIPIQAPQFQYIEVTESCGPYFEGPCLNARSGPGLQFPIVTKLRNGMVLKIGGQVERDGIMWYKVLFDERLRYPERVSGDWYVAADYVRVLMGEGVRDLADARDAPGDKRIEVSRTAQMLYAYEGDELFMQEPISTGLELTPTPAGTFTIYRKTPTRYMQGPLPGITDKYWDLPGVPWNLYFSKQGAVIHGAYWHDNFGRPASAGCVNMRPEAAEKLYQWAELGTKVIVKD